MSYKPIIHTLNSNPKNNILDYNEDPEFSRNIDYPIFELGFQHFVHQSKDKMEIIEKFKGKKKVYYVINEFERYVDDYNKDINSVATTYFDLKNKPNILSRAFFKLWELLFMFDLIDLNNKNFTSAHLAEGPGSFVQATMFYRDKYTEKNLSKNDKYFAVTLHNETSDVKKHIPKLEDKFVKYYESEKPVRFVMHKTYPKGGGSVSNSDNDSANNHDNGNDSNRDNGSVSNHDNGDLTDEKTRILFGGNFKDKKADFVTADGGFDWGYENLQEQEALKLILSQILTAISIQAKGGNFVCKFYESFTITTAKILNILPIFYNKVHLVKPFMSRASNSEKYAVCLDFLDPKDKDKRIKKINDLINLMNKNDKLNLVKVFPEFILEEDFKSTLIKANLEIANKQFKTINEMITFINNENYRGEEYTNRREMQINASQFWISHFFPDKDFKGKKKEIENTTSEIIEKNLRK